MSRVLVPLPDHDFDVTEVSVPWKLLTRAGHEVVFATQDGATPVGDPLLITGVIFGQLGAEDQAKAFYLEMTMDPRFLSPIRWEDVRPEDYQALLLPGGHAPGMRQYLGSGMLQQRVGEFWQLDRPVAAICHGVLLLARSRRPDGRSVLYDRRTTCLRKYQERLAYFLTAWKLGRYYRTYPEYTEDEVRSFLAKPVTQFQDGPYVLTAKGTETDDRPAFVVEDGRYLSARWPGDAYLLAKKLLQRL